MPLIVVTGHPRSGTSMAMHMLQAGGVPCFYEELDSRPANPDGFFEVPAVMQGDFSSVPDGHAVKCLQMLPTVARELPALAGAVFIVMRRPLPEIAASMTRQAALRGRPPVTVADHGEIIAGSIGSVRLWTAGKPHVEVWKQDCHDDTAHQCLRMARLIEPVLGHFPDLAAMAGIPRPRSY